MQFKDYYQVLGVPRDATADQVKKAWRRLARQYHPDVSKAPDAAARMSEINEANTVLSDPERRAAYDALGQGRHPGEAFTPPPGWGSGFEFTGGMPGGHNDGDDDGDFSEFFEQLFGHLGARPGARTRRHPHAAARGQDHHARVLLDLEDAFAGATRQVTLQAAQRDAQGRVTMQPRTLDVKIPAGVRPGQLIRLAGQGAPGAGGAPAGDLFLEVQFRPHPRFHVEGRNLAAELPVAPWEAALGAVVPLQLPDGQTLKVRVPAGAQSGRRLGVRGKGWPGTPPGDLDLTLRVLLPSGLDPRAKRLYEQMAAALPDFDARRVAQAEAERETAGGNAG